MQQAQRNRTLIVGMGDTGERIITEVQAILENQIVVSGNTIATLSHAADGDLEQYAESFAASVEAVLRSLSHVQAEVAGPIRLRSRHVDLMCAAALDEPAAAHLVDLAYLLRYVVRSRLNAPTRLTACLLLPDTLLDTDDDEDTHARAQTAFTRLHAYMQPHDGYLQEWGSLRIEGWGPAVDGTCYLIDALNQNGLTLETRAARCQMVAHAIAYLAATPLGQAAAAHSPAAKPGYGRYASLGCGMLVYPQEYITSYLRWDVAVDLIDRVVGGQNATVRTVSDAPARMQAALVSRGVTIEAVTEDAEKLPPEIPPLWQVLREGEAGLGREVSATEETTFDASVRKRLRAVIMEEVRSSLDDAGCETARAAVDTIETYFAERWRSHEESVTVAETALDETFRRCRQYDQTLTKLARSLPTSWFALARTVLWPLGWLRLWRRWRQFRRTYLAYTVERGRLHRHRQERQDALLTQTFVEHILDTVTASRQHLIILCNRLHEVADILRAGRGARFAPDTPYDLAWSVAPLEVVKALQAKRGRSRVATVPRASEWLESTPAVETLVAAFHDAADIELAWIDDVSMLDVLERRFSERRAQRAFVRNFIYACAPFFWGSQDTFIPRVERPRVIVGVPAEEVDAFAWLEQEHHMPASVVPFPLRHRIVVLRTRIVSASEVEHRAGALENDYNET